MALTPIGEAALISREAVKLVAYLDSVGVWTIGIGHTAAAGPPVPKKGMRITRAQAMEIFRRDLVQYERAVDDAITREMEPHERDAFVSICYNIGPGAFRRATFVRRFNAGDLAGCASAIMAWVKPKEVTSRRTAERDQFLTPYSISAPKARSTDRTRVRVVPGPLGGGAPSTYVSLPGEDTPEPVQPVGATPKGALSGLWALIQGKPPVPAPVRSEVRQEVKAERPDIAKDLGGLRLAGLGGLAASVLGGAQDSGLLDTVQATADSVGSTAASVRSLADILLSAIRWGVSHWWVFGLLLSAYVLFRVGWAVFRVYAYIQERRAVQIALEK